MATELSPRQRQILTVVRRSTRQRGYPPSIREICAEVGLTSTSSVARQLAILEDRGLLSRGNRAARALDARQPNDRHDARPTDRHEDRPTDRSAHRSTDRPAGRPAQHPTSSAHAGPDNETARDTGNDASTTVPLLGAIAAGAPIPASEDFEENFTLPTSLVGHGELFALRIRGDSMIDAAICDGDIVVVRRQATAESGEIVAAMLDGEATVKVLDLTPEHVRLLPRNEHYEPIPADDAEILGRVVSVLRRLS
ncbi:transcriptional repressor LexA [Cryptosporangium phraense]|nr:transcriptional repressor LexA [Cryptosporangium phraense]